MESLEERTVIRNKQIFRCQLEKLDAEIKSTQQTYYSIEELWRIWKALLELLEDLEVRYLKNQELLYTAIEKDMKKLRKEEAEDIEFQGQIYSVKIKVQLKVKDIEIQRAQSSTTSTNQQVPDKAQEKLMEKLDNIRTDTQKIGIMLFGEAWDNAMW